MEVVTTHINPTTRRHPRTLNEAFGTGPRYACGIERTPRSSESTAERVLGVALACFVGFSLAMALVSWWAA